MMNIMAMATTIIAMITMAMVTMQNYEHYGNGNKYYGNGNNDNGNDAKKGKCSI